VVVSSWLLLLVGNDVVGAVAMACFGIVMMNGSSNGGGGNTTAAKF